MSTTNGTMVTASESMVTTGTRGTKTDTTGDTRSGALSGINITKSDTKGNTSSTMGTKSDAMGTTGGTTII